MKRKKTKKRIEPEIEIKKNWAVVELNIMGEKEEKLKLIQEDLIRILPDLDVFIPVYWNDDVQFSKKIYLVEGYVFVRNAKTDRHYFLLEQSKYVSNVVSYKTGKGKIPDFVSDIEISKLKEKLNSYLKKDFQKKDKVNILDGDYKNLIGQVISILNEKEVVVQILGIRSAEVIVKIQKVFLEKKYD